MKKLLVIGAGGHARPVIETLILLGSWDIIGIIDLKFSGQNEEILGVRVIGGLEIIEDCQIKNDINIFPAIGKNSLRKSIYQLLMKKDYEIPNIIHPSSQITKSTSLGKGNYVGPNTHIGSKTIIGKANILNSSSVFEHESKMGDYNHLAPGAVICGRCEIGNEVLVGANATIIDNIKIADRITIGAGAVVIKDIDETDQTIVGIPGRKI